MRSQQKKLGQTQSIPDQGYSLIDRIDICEKTRIKTCQQVSKVLSESQGRTEIELSDSLHSALIGMPELYQDGWYDPPPNGIGVLFGGEGHIERSQFPTLRRQEFWPSPNYVLGLNTTAMVYVSPVHRLSGTIADFGMTFYRGNDKRIQDHLRSSLEAIEDIAESVEVGMQFGELFALAQKLLDQRGLHNDWMVTFNDPLRGSDYGHSVPWSDKLPTQEEQVIINSGKMPELKPLLEKSRVYINQTEAFVIPKTIAFSVEPRLGSKAHPDLPGAYYYAFVLIRDGVKKIITNLNPIFKAIGISYMESRF